jgi:hypothetical protein
MGIDINALIVIGREDQELEIANAPYYKELAEGESWSRLVNDVYYLKDDKRLDKLQFVQTHYDNYEGVIGFVIADSGSWDWEVLSAFDLMNDIATYANLFGELFGIEGQIILMPRWW